MQMLRERSGWRSGASARIFLRLRSGGCHGAAQRVREAFLYVRRESDELLRAGTKLLAQRGRELDLFGDEVRRRLRIERRLRLREAPLQIVARNGELITADPLQCIHAFFLCLERRRECLAIGLEDCLWIKCRLAHDESPATLPTIDRALLYSHCMQRSIHLSSHI